VRGPELIARCQAAAGRACPCGAAICNHERLMSVAAGYADAPRCAECLGRALGRTRDAVAAHVAGLAEHRTCFGEAWSWATEADGPCAYARVTPAPARAEPGEAGGSWDAEWDAG